MSGRVDVTHVPKPWGYEKIWANTDRYVGKMLHINAGQALSVQYHERKDETVYLLAGEMKYWVSPGEATGDRPAIGRGPRGRAPASRRRLSHHAGDGALHGSGHRLRRARGIDPGAR